MSVDPYTASPAAPPIPFAKSEVVPEALEQVARVLGSGWMTTGPEVGEFEREFGQHRFLRFDQHSMAHGIGRFHRSGADFHRSQFGGTSVDSG